MAQARPALAIDGVIDVLNSNREQQRGPHGAFRYFGKLAPDVTGRVLDLAVQELGRPGGPVVDPMCGSGTTLLEASDRGWLALGFDVNPVALLYSEVKTHPPTEQEARRALRRVLAEGREPTESDVDAVFGATRNASRWFSPHARSDVTRLRGAIEDLPKSRAKDLMLAVLLASLRRVSNASSRTGRIFYDPASAVADVGAEFTRTAERAMASLDSGRSDVQVAYGDARALPIDGATAGMVFLHPPYFALYRYSSDVLRFELEVGGWSRSEIVPTEVREGWKSGDPDNLNDHVSDMEAAFVEAGRVVMDGGSLILVTSNSTLGDEQLPVVDRLAEAAEGVGWRLQRHFERVARNGSATYHRSKRIDKVIAQDHVLMFSKP